MKRWRQGFGLMLILGLAVSPGALAGGGQKGDLELGLFAGQGFLDDYEGANPDDDILYGARIGYFFTPGWSIEGSYQTLSTQTNLVTPPVDMDIDSARLNLLYNYRADQRLRPFVTLGAGQETADAGTALDEDGIGINAGGGVRWFLSDAFGLRFDVRAVSTDLGGVVDSRQENLEASVGLTFTFGGGPPPDEDGDGVKDSADKCPGTPQGATVDATGCPSDADGDGVYDGLDKCPGTPKGAKVNATGCPADEDGDGVYDGLDKCPGTPKGAKVDTTGCPADEDGDGVYDGLDKCPGTPKGTKVDKDGCPVPEPPKPPPPPPPPLPPAPTKEPLVLQGVNFEVDSAKLTPDSSAVLDRVADSLKAWPDVTVEVAGHTDSSGSDAHNLRLSQQRSEAVRDYLVAQGASAAKIIAKGYGETKPIADNATKEGKAKNRRVELRRVD